MTLPGFAGRRCGVFMSPFFRDPHPTCARCGGVKCTADVTCDICKDWSVMLWEAFLKRHLYSEFPKKCHSGCALPSVSHPSARVSPFRPLPGLLQKSDALGHSTPPEGRDRSGEVEGVPCVGSREVSPPPLPPFSGRGGGERREGLGFCGRERFGCFFPPGVGVAGSSHSQESLVLADPSPVYSSIPAGGDCRSSSHRMGGSTGDRSRSSHLSPSRGRDSREERRCAHTQSRGSCAWSQESRCLSTDR